MRTDERQPATDGRVAVLAGAVLWGTAGTAVALGPSEAEVWQVAAVRLGLGAPLMLVVSVLVLGGTRLPRPAGMAVAAAGALAVFQLGYFTAVTSVGVALGTAVAIGSAPIAAGALQWVGLRLRPDRAWWFSTSLAVVGVVLLLGASRGAAGSSVGVLAGLGAGVAFATFTVTSRRVLDTQPEPLTVMGWLLFGASIPLVVVAVVLTAATGSDWSWAATPAGFASLAWLVVAATGIGYLVFGTGLVRVPPASAATLTLAEPLTAVVLGVGILAERPTVVETVGGLLVLIGLVVLVIGGRRPARRRPSPRS